MQDALLARIAEDARALLDGAAPQGFADWVKRYFRAAAMDTLNEREPGELARVAVTHFQFACSRRPAQVLIRLTRPTPDQRLARIQVCADDMPFLVDTLVMAVRDAGSAVDWSVHPVFRLQRRADGQLDDLRQTDGDVAESWVHLECEALHEAGAYAALQASILERLADLRLAVTDYPTMRARLRSAIRRMSPPPASADADEARESCAFLEWLDDGHFTFLACAETVLKSGADGKAEFRPIPESGLGLAREGAHFADMETLIAPRQELNKYADSPRIIVLTKAAQRSKLHHPDYVDQVSVKLFNDEGRIGGTLRFIGLFSADAYVERPWEIPLIRRKVDWVMRRFNLRSGSHSAKQLRQILHDLPRDELFQADERAIFDACAGIRALRDRHPLRLFLRRDRYGRFFSAMVYLPRERFSRDLRDRLAQHLQAACGGYDADRAVDFLRGGLARVHITVRTEPGAVLSTRPEEIEKSLIEIARPWRERLLTALASSFPEDAERLASRYGDAIPSDYAERVGVEEAALDVIELEKLSAEHPLIPRLHLHGGASCRLKLFAFAQPRPLAEVLPLFESFGLRAIRQELERVCPGPTRDVDGELRWIQDFAMDSPTLDVAADRADFEAAFVDVLEGRAEADSLNALVLSAGLNARRVSLLRMLCAYAAQVGLPYGREGLKKRVSAHPLAARCLVQGFEARFDPAIHPDQRSDRETEAQAALEAAIDAVQGLDADRILRLLASIVRAGLRTNFYQPDDQGRPKAWISLKLDSAGIAELPRPRPVFETWVYSPQTEGVHLRGGRIARGGLRWSDRNEDFRTEILGLMKAQQVKNAVIVPAGAKGGFVVRQPSADRAELQQQGVDCYRSFIRGLLDITDNRVGDAIVPPPAVVRHDGDDPYLVVAADKGTARFSDIANAVSQDYGFWLGDAFASGGSAGYDHKQMGITARGAWESVKRHFLELGVDTQCEPFTVVGIGDMSGDVFGNGMLLSPHIRLLAAFDHRHIFVDPTPDAARGFAERQRLFALSRSCWADYDAALISEGGGVYARGSKWIELSAAASRALGVEARPLRPNEVIQAILRAPADLLWNGGVGTYVKATSESSEQAQDRANDALRVNASELRVRVIGEGGNLGLTQAARVEFAAAGGRINTDAIDNSGGVHSSDREVNIKIPLNQLMAEGALSRAERDALLISMTDEVAQAVLEDNAQQSACVSLMALDAGRWVDEHLGLMHALEREGELDRALEGLPSDDQVQQRRAKGGGLLRPELSVLAAYAKNALFGVALESGLAADRFFAERLLRYFPAPMTARFAASIAAHRLGPEIVATSCANQVVNRMGAGFVQQMALDQSLAPAVVLKAFFAAQAVMDADACWQAVEAMQGRCPMAALYRCKWLLRDGLAQISAALSTRLGEQGIGRCVAHYSPLMAAFVESLPDGLPPAYRQRYDQQLEALAAESLPDHLAHLGARMQLLGCLPDIADLAEAGGVWLDGALWVYFELGQCLRMPWLQAAIARLPADNRWRVLARARLRQDLGRLHRQIAARVLKAADTSPEQRLSRWKSTVEDRLTRSRTCLSELQAADACDFAGMSVALRALEDLARS